jgi:3-deoxy-D-manno-octulosonate 8-phosphate phosphatase (KDO 8-P phosphatase)
MTHPVLARVRLVVFDFDGVFTDNRVLVHQDGSEAVFCSRADGLGVQLLQRAGVACVVLSTETNPVVEARCRKLDLPCVQGAWDKVAALERLLAERGVEATDVAYVGNDVNDLACLARVGVPIVVADAHPAVKAVATLVTTRRGGEGAVREICEWLLEARGMDVARAFEAARRE